MTFPTQKALLTVIRLPWHKRPSNKQLISKLQRQVVPYLALVVLHPSMAVPSPIYHRSRPMHFRQDNDYQACLSQ